MNFTVFYLKQHKKFIYLFLLFGLIFAVTFSLYHLPLKVILYPLLLCFFTGSVFVAYDYLQKRKKHLLLSEIKNLSELMLQELPEISSVDDADYQEIIKILCEEQRNLSDLMDRRYTDMVEYYTVWVHQIKTPIASMRLTLQNEDSAIARRLSSDLFRIEQYVEMVLMFLRVDSSSTDYVIKEYDLDAVIKQSVKKFAGEFIGRKIRLEYTPIDMKVITDEKWLSFVIEQVLSNALKYTPAGSVKIYLTEDGKLCIEDTGIGIAPEDLPRIFEKGYTGYNGRSDKKASGIGLYLCRKVCGNLRHEITAESKIDVGTKIFIDLNREKLEIE